MSAYPGCGAEACIALFVPPVYGGGPEETVSEQTWYQTAKFKWTSSMAIIWLIVDQATKIWVVKNIKYRVEEIQVIDGFFSLVHAQNKGKR